MRFVILLPLLFLLACSSTPDEATWVLDCGSTLADDCADDAADAGTDSGSDGATGSASELSSADDAK